MARPPPRHFGLRYRLMIDRLIDRDMRLVWTVLWIVRIASPDTPSITTSLSLLAPPTDDDLAELTDFTMIFVGRILDRLR